MILMGYRWHWLESTKHMFSSYLIISHLLVSATAQLEGSQLVENLDNLNEVTEDFKNSLFNFQEQFDIRIGHFNRPDSIEARRNKLSKKLNDLKWHIPHENDVYKDVDNMAERISVIEKELEDLYKQLDSERRGTAQKFDEFSSTLTNISSSNRQLNDLLKKRLLVYEEPILAKQVEKALLKRDYVTAWDKFNLITNDNVIKIIINNVYNDTQDIDILLYFGSNIRNVSRRALIFTTVYEEIKPNIDLIKIEFHDINVSVMEHNRNVLTCDVLKLINTFENDIMKSPETSKDLRQSVSKIVKNLKSEFNTGNNDNSTEEKGEIFATRTLNFVNDRIVLSTSIIINKTEEIVVMKLEILLNKTKNSDKINCLCRNSDVMYDLSFLKKTKIAEGMLKMLERSDDLTGTSLDANSRGQKVVKPIENLGKFGKMFEEALFNKNYKDASIAFKMIRDKHVIRAVIRNVYLESQDIYNFLDFTNRTEIINESDVILSALFEEILSIKYVVICELLKFIDMIEYIIINNNYLKLTTYENIQSLSVMAKTNVTFLIKTEINKKLALIKNITSSKNTYFIANHDYNHFSIYDESSLNLLAQYEYFLDNSVGVQQGYCYFSATVDMMNYDMMILMMFHRFMLIAAAMAALLGALIQLLFMCNCCNDTKTVM